MIKFGFTSHCIRSCRILPPPNTNAWLVCALQSHWQLPITQQDLVTVRIYSTCTILPWLPSNPTWYCAAMDLHRRGLFPLRYFYGRLYLLDANSFCYDLRALPSRLDLKQCVIIRHTILHACHTLAALPSNSKIDAWFSHYIVPCCLGNIYYMQVQHRSRRLVACHSDFISLSIQLHIPKCYKHAATQVLPSNPSLLYFNYHWA